VARAGLAPAPFNVVPELAATCIWHSPPAVTTVEGISMDADQIAAPERELIDQRLDHVPVTTLSPHHANRHPLGDTRKLARTLDRGERYPLVSGRERRQARSSYGLWRASTAAGLRGRGSALVAAVLNWPANPALRHALKARLGR
jgi:hypothetical protein